MIKTTTPFVNTEKAAATPVPAEKDISRKAAEFGPSDFTIQNILNYSKALQVIKTAQNEPVFGVMN